MSKKVVVCCDIDDTLWDLLFYWIKYNNYLHNCGDTRYQLLDEDLNNYTTWSMSDKFIDKKYKDNFFNLLSSVDMWATIQVDLNRIKTLEKLNNDKRIKLYIVTAMKINNYVKLQRFKQLFPFIDDDQIIVCYDKWLLRSDIWIDDKAETLEKCKQYGEVIKINKSHNKNVNMCYLSVDDFSELYSNKKFEKLIKKLYEEKKEK